MKMYFYRGHTPNFGDELNNLLMPKVFPNFFDEDEREIFLGIGSVLYDFFPAAAKKVVFGTGYGGYTAPPVLDASWDVFCVRGPRTAQVLGLAADKVAGDAAILINQHHPLARQPGRDIGFIPHFESIGRGHWRRACQLVGIRFIDPRDPVETVLAAMQSCRFVITEAMHGAIVSDALRVPWTAILPFDGRHHMKWFDWAESLDMTLSFAHVAPSSLREAYKALKSEEPAWMRGGAGRMAVRAVDIAFIAAAAATLKLAALRAPAMSADGAMDRVLDKLNSNAEKIIKTYGGEQAARRREATV